METKFNNNYDSRSCVIGVNGVCASSQTLASQVGVDVLKRGGNAADAAVAMASMLNLTQPCSTGIGGDCFVLFWNNTTKQIHGINGSGRAPKNLNIEILRKINITGDSIPPESPMAITIPGAAAAWCDTIEKFGSGKLTMMEILQQTIDYCEQGVPIQQKTAVWWDKSSHQLKNSPNGDEMLINGKPPLAGDIFRNPNLANTFRLLAQHGKQGYYKGVVADAIVKVINDLGGVLSHDDLESHSSTFDTPISVNYRGYNVHEMPPNGQGITALVALNILEGFDLASLGPHSEQHIHLMIEALRLSFADTRYYVADPAYSKKGYPANSSSTVYLSVVDKHGNGCSFINSNYMSFGTGIIPKGCGFTLQNRGSNFVLDESHPNALQPGKRPYHTIIPGMITKDGELFATFGVMGGFIQPQAHVQTVVNLIDHRMDPQSALSHPRFFIDDGTKDGIVLFEPGVPQQIINNLQARGHNVQVEHVQGDDRRTFGNGQVIVVKSLSEANNNSSSRRVLVAGSDNRCDGVATAY
ncbi:hypothetical protein SAMD00019534_043710 [Acytostelium subglobosum LB1]|uniref:hypothetical protein n=1 Tax=Acytostelium subglobosum LB1 TaxID=1410327 RepID=UPI0006451743|nr:hypothetical protein SAMD00019534_043710 [Acytostelium subglobosum LB1]GAM21196.1 hypothetical protein SAMD00019534_043710 [Acytostelium subglobosum LB1]|eukprot:XP_012756330.1 hypothetical protein SAMD00019534_043710 [Acytostelium subglobosum LB1]